MEASTVVVALCTVFFYQGPFATADHCLDRFMDLSLIQFRGGRIGELNEAGISRMNHEIRFMTNIDFTCSSTQIDSVIVGIDIKRTTNRNMYPSVQLWRESGTLVELVSQRMIIYTPDNTSSTGIHEYQLTPPLTANPGDYLAVSQPDQSTSVVRVHTVDVGMGSSYLLPLGTTFVDLSTTPEKNRMVLLHPKTAQPNCITSTVTESFVKEQSLYITESAAVRDQRQYIYPDMKFTCNGTINKWIYAGLSKSSTTRPELQVWRLLVPGNTYSKIGSSQVIANETNDLSNVHEFTVDPPIEFMEGDVFGLYQPDLFTASFIMYSQEDSGPKNFRIDVVNTLDKIESRSLRVADNDYPLVTMEISQYRTNIPVIHQSTTSMLSALVSTGPSTVTPVPNDNSAASSLIGGIVAVGLFIVMVIISVTTVIIVFIRRSKQNTQRQQNTPSDEIIPCDVNPSYAQLAVNHVMTKPNVAYGTKAYDQDRYIEQSVYIEVAD